MSDIEFKAWPKTPRLNRQMVITEKIDGTNAAVIITEDGQVAAQSRTRLITPGKSTDNFGFAAWVEQNKLLLAETLGPGYHYGEWWGVGIQRGYGLRERRFSLFNAARWPGDSDAEWAVKPEIGLYSVPVLDILNFSTEVANGWLENLRVHGSKAAPGFMRPEGIVVYVAAANVGFKALLENDEVPKALAS